MRILVTGCAGFIGLFVTKKLLSRNEDILGIDNMNEYYDPELKKSRLNQIKNIKEGNFTFIEEDLCELKKIERIFKKEKISKVIHLAATPGVRYSIENPHAYVQNNLVAFTNVLELCRHYDVDHFTYAVPVVYTVQTLTFLILRKEMQTTLYNFMRQQKKQMKLWRIATAICINCRLQV